MHRRERGLQPRASLFGHECIGKAMVDLTGIAPVSLACEANILLLNDRPETVRAPDEDRTRLPLIDNQLPSPDGSEGRETRLRGP